MRTDSLTDALEQWMYDRQFEYADALLIIALGAK